MRTFKVVMTFSALAVIVFVALLNWPSDKSKIQNEGIQTTQNSLPYDDDSEPPPLNRLGTNNPLKIDEGTNGTITADLLNIDNDSSPSEVKYTITIGTTNGAILLGGEATTTFTQADVNTGWITYQHNGSETTRDAFDFTVDDGQGSRITDRFNINVSPVNDEPVFTTNNPLRVNEVASGTITTYLLNTTDVDNTDSELNYNITAPATNGTVLLSGLATTSFTQADVNTGLIIYQHEGGQKHADSFEFTVDDGQGASTDGTFVIDVFSHTVTLPTLPQEFVDTSFVGARGGALFVVQAGDDLQAVLNAASPGDTIVLAAGATFTGNFFLPDKTETPEGGDWIYIVSSELDQLPEGERVGPEDAVHMPKIVSPNQNPALWTDFGSDHYRIAGIEISTDMPNFNLVLMGWGLENETDPWWDRTRADSVDEQPHHITFDRVYLHSTSDTNRARTGILADGKHIAVIDSYLSNFKDGSDAQAIVVWSGQGPYKIVNNLIEATGENIMFGGETIPIPDLVPSDIEIRGNHFYKRLEWKADPNQWVVKNLFELKAAQRILISGNVFENSWADDQAGFGILFTVRNHGVDGDTPWVVVQDVTFENNIVRHVGQGILISAEDDLQPSQQTKRILISNNVIEDVNEDNYANTKFLSLNTHDRPILDLTVRNNLFLHTTGQLGNSAMNLQYSGINVDRCVFENNIFTHGIYGIFAYGAASWDESMANYSIKNNGFIFNAGPEDDYYQANFATLNPDNLKADTLDEVGFVDYENGDYHLEAWSPFKNAETDGKDLGPDWDQLLEATNGVIDP